MIGLINRKPRFSPGTELRPPRPKAMGTVSGPRKSHAALILMLRKATRPV